MMINNKEEEKNGEKQSVGKKDTKFPIVGVGASAGGLEAFKAFFSGMEDDSKPGMAFVLIQHMAPDHNSMLSNIVSGYTDLEVFLVEDGMKVKPNCIYVIPPNKEMTIVNGKLQLKEPTKPRKQRFTIDYFFRSLAKDQGEYAIGVVLSGTGSDGTRGLLAIKKEGGMTIVQSPSSAKFDGMPESAMGTGMVDFDLPPEKIPNLLSTFDFGMFYKDQSASAPQPETENMLKKITKILRYETGHDFSQYKTNTIKRRVEQRMAVNQIDDIKDYMKFLDQESEEAESLFRELLIGVTSFFRNPEEFKIFEKECLSTLLDNKSPDETIRIWIAGCSTGEEAYSMAMIVAEQLEKHKRRIKVEMFATDIDKKAIKTARAGIYPARIAEEVSEERLSKHFDKISTDNKKSSKKYRIKKNIRDMLIFSDHNIIEDPPFSRQDVISCRNLLIYMNSELQKKVISLFHYGLNPGGYLFLGNSETVGDLDDLFATVSSKAKIFKRKEGPQSTYWTKANRMLGPKKSGNKNYPSRKSEKTSSNEKESLKRYVEQELLKHLAVTGVLVNETGDILYIHGRSGKYLEPASWVSDRNIRKMIRDGLESPLNAALHNAVKKESVTRYQGISVETDGDPLTVDLTVRPVPKSQNFDSDDEHYLIVLEDSAEKKFDISDYDPETEEDPRVEALLKELHEKEEYLKAANEELEISNEELKSSNEELQSVNEELQSANEELETSKEELQSVNEELSTVNAELEAKVADLSRANNDMNNLLAGTGIATVFVDLDLNIMRFTPTATRIINLIDSDIGRPVGHIVSNLQNYDSLVEDIEEVLDTLKPKKRKVKTNEGKRYRMHIQPYRTLENVIEGAVITFVKLEEVEEDMKESATEKNKSDKTDESEAEDHDEKAE